MELVTISQMTRMFGVSTRTFRYYESIGLIQSTVMEGYAYRVYDEAAVERMRQIQILRKLRISLKQIAAILAKPEAVAVIDVFQRKISELDEEVTALSTLRSILERFISELRMRSEMDIAAIALADESLSLAIDTLSVNKKQLQEEKTMSDLTRANQALTKLTDVRILTLPPSRVACAHYIGEEPELHAKEMMARFARESGLFARKPDVRSFGFNHPNPTQSNPTYGYEIWHTIPEDMDVPAPLEKRFFEGGLYAAHMIRIGSFEEWEQLWQWVEESPRFERNLSPRGGEIMDGLLEEHLNIVYNEKMGIPEDEIQLDLLIPIKERSPRNPS